MDLMQMISSNFVRWAPGVGSQFRDPSMKRWKSKERTRRMSSCSEGCGSNGRKKRRRNVDRNDGSDQLTSRAKGIVILRT